MLMEILSYVIQFVLQTGFLLLALWAMIKIQKLDYNFLALVGTAALGSGLDMIPYFGHYIAVPALYICIWKTTRSDLFPDAVFTVVVAYALTFCMNLFVIGALMGDLRPSADSNEFESPAADVSDDSETDQPVAEPQAYAKTNKVANTVKSATVPNVQKQTTSKKPAGQSKEPPSEVEIVKNFSLKGVVRSTGRSTATIDTGTKTYTINKGEALTMQSSKGIIVVRCDEVTGDSVTLNVGGESVELFLR
jgi:Tfp pilus assembly protein PilP